MEHLVSVSRACHRKLCFLYYRAFRHTERNIADTGLNLLLEICMSFETSDFATQFYQAYHLQLLQEVFAVMTGGRLFVRTVRCCGIGGAAVDELLLNCKHRAHGRPLGGSQATQVRECMQAHVATAMDC